MTPLDLLLTPDERLYNWLVYTTNGNMFWITAITVQTIAAVLYKFKLYAISGTIYTKQELVYDVLVKVPSETTLALVLATFVTKYWGGLAGIVLIMNSLFYILKTQPTNELIVTVFKQKMERNV